MNEEKRKKLVEAFADFASDYKDFIIKDSGSVSECTDIYRNYLRTKVTFSLELAKPIKEGDEIYHKEASEFAKVFSDMYNEFQKVVLNNK